MTHTYERQQNTGKPPKIPFGDMLDDETVTYSKTTQIQYRYSNMFGLSGQ